ncbi:MAG: rhomboid family intramembrane serine protease [Eubacteriales bacterium]|nr:rhomboid family intramembrane serine protease [Eubacteriales bacterium]
MERENGTSKQQTGIAAFLRAHKVSLVICAVYWAVYLLGLCIGQDVLYGALSGSGFQKLNGQVYRLITASFLHGSWLHLISNTAALLCVGHYLEQCCGARRFTEVYILIDVLASVMFYGYFSECTNGAGSSIVLFGLFAVLLILWLRYPEEFPVRRYPWQVLYLVLYFIAANIVGGNYTTIIIHAFSFTAGLAVGLVMLWVRARREKNDAAQI